MLWLSKRFVIAIEQVLAAKIMNLEPSSAFFPLWPERFIFFFFFLMMVTLQSVLVRSFLIITRNPGLPEPACHWNIINVVAKSLIWRNLCDKHSKQQPQSHKEMSRNAILHMGALHDLRSTTSLGGLTGYPHWILFD